MTLVSALLYFAFCFGFGMVLAGAWWRSSRVAVNGALLMILALFVWAAAVVS